MRSQWVVLSIIVVMLFGLSSLAHGSFRDQGQIWNTGGALELETEEWSQSITTGFSGQLTKIMIMFHDEVPAQPPALNLSIFDGGNPISGSALFSEQLFITSTDLDEDNQFTWEISNAGLLFNAGDVFSFVLQADGVGYNIAGNDPPGYVGGELFKNGMPNTELSDIAFITYIDPVQVNDFVTFEPDTSTYLFDADTTDCQTGAVGKFSFDAKLTNISEKELLNLYVEVDELTNDNLLLTDEGLKGEGDIFKLAPGYRNVALNASVDLQGAPFFEGGIGGGQIVNEDTIVDGIFLPRAQQWDQGPVWWDSTDGEDRYIEINLDDEYTINSFIVQADENDAYKLYYWDIMNSNWQVVWDVPNFNTIQGTGMVTRPNPEDESEKYFLSNPIRTDVLLFRGNLDDGDRQFSISEIQAFSGDNNDFSGGILSPGEYVDVPFCICLQDKSAFRFSVNVLGVAKGMTENPEPVGSVGTDIDAIDESSPSPPLLSPVINNNVTFDFSADPETAVQKSEANNVGCFIDAVSY